jgi:hypothetical protein
MITFPMVIIVVVGFFNFVYLSCSNTTLACNIDFKSFIVNNPLGYILTGNIVGLINAFNVNAVYQGQTPAADVCYIAHDFWQCSSTDYTGIFFSILGLAAGVMLFILGLGITVSAQVVSTGGSIGANSQGAKQMMAWGIGLIVYSWFSGWASLLWSGTWALPYQLGSALWAVLTIIYAYGLYEAGRTIT